MFAADLMLLEQSGGTGTDRKSGEGGDSGLEISARYLLLSQTAITRGTEEIAAECASDCIARVSQIASTCSMQSQEWVDADFDITNDKMPLPPAAVDENVVWAKASEIYDCGGELFLRSRTEDQHCHVEVGKYDSSALFSAATLLSYAQLQALVIAYDTFANVYGLRLFVNGRWQFIIVDGMVACTRKPDGGLIPMFARSGVAGELWPILLEKAYMKVRGGCAIPPTDTIENAWQMLSGGVCTLLDSPTLDAAGHSPLDHLCDALAERNVVVAYVRPPDGGGAAVVLQDGREEKRSVFECTPSGNLAVVDYVVDRVVCAHSGSPGRPTKFEVQEADFAAQVGQLLAFRTVPTQWSSSVLFGTLITDQSLDLCIFSMVEDMRCCISIAPWKTAEAPAGKPSSSVHHRLRFKLTSMSIAEWDQFDGDRATLINRLRRRANPNRGDGPADPPASKSLHIELSSDRVYFLIPHVQRHHSDATSPASPSAEQVEEAVGYTLRVDANKFRLSLQSHDTYCSTVGRAVAEFGIYRPQQKRRQSSSRASSPTEHNERVDVPESLQQLTSLANSSMHQLQNIRIVVLCDAVATLMGECPAVAIKHCRFFKPRGSPIGLTLFSPNGGTGVHVKRIREGTAAERVIGLNISDVLLEVNGVATFRYESTPSSDHQLRYRRVWCTHEEVIALLVRAGVNFTMLVCSRSSFESIPSISFMGSPPSGCVAIEESGLVKLMPQDKQIPRGRLGFASWQLSTISKYREKAAALQDLHASGNLEDYEYKACLKAAVVNAYWTGTTLV
eukprot:m.150803 g.150803  ORF g.150803 m.150803 type:complete len:789 (-) comp23327_c0_seq1:201-2567(-)